MNLGNLTAFLNFIELLSVENLLATSLVNIAERVLQEQDYSTVLYVSRRTHANGRFNTNSVLKALGTRAHTPVVLIHGDAVLSLNEYNRQVLAIVKIEQPSGAGDAGDEALLRSFWKIMQRNMQSRVILLVENAVAVANGTYVTNLLKFCARNNAMNTIVLLGSAQGTWYYHAMQIFPKLEIVTGSLMQNRTDPIFPDKVRNMQGYKIRLVVDQVEPKSYIHYDAEGQVILSGYVGKLFVEFARLHNATLTYPLMEELGPGLYSGIMEEMLKNGTYDMSTGLTLDYRTTDFIRTHSYESMDWCIMLPVEKPLPSYMFYVIVFDYTTLALMVVALMTISFIRAITLSMDGQKVGLIDYVFNVQALNALLGQPFVVQGRMWGMMSVVYLIVCFSGIILNTTYSSYLQSLEARSPREPPLRSMDEMLEAGMKLAIYREEVATMCRTMPNCEKYRPLLHVINNYRDYFALRDSFDTRYAFPVPSAKWTFYKVQQKFFSAPVFRLSNICIVQSAANLITLPVNSIYVDALNTLIGQVHQAGLMQFWKSLAFIELVKLGRVRIVDLGSKEVFVPMELQDLYLVLVMFGLSHFVIFCIFLLELFWAHRANWAQVVKEKLRR